MGSSWFCQCLYTLDLRVPHTGSEECWPSLAKDHLSTLQKVDSTSRNPWRDSWQGWNKPGLWYWSQSQGSLGRKWSKFVSYRIARIGKAFLCNISCILLAFSQSICGFIWNLWVGRDGMKELELHDSAGIVYNVLRDRAPFESCGFCSSSPFFQRPISSTVYHFIWSIWCSDHSKFWI
jgi:hypothetical protein